MPQSKKVHALCNGQTNIIVCVCVCVRVHVHSTQGLNIAYPASEFVFCSLHTLHALLLV